MNRKLLVPSLLVVLMLVSCTMAGKDGDTIIIGEDGGIVYKGGGKKVSLIHSTKKIANVNHFSFAG